MLVKVAKIPRQKRCKHWYWWCSGVSGKRIQQCWYWHSQWVMGLVNARACKLAYLRRRKTITLYLEANEAKCSLSRYWSDKYETFVRHRDGSFAGTEGDLDLLGLPGEPSLTDLIFSIIKH